MSTDVSKVSRDLFAIGELSVHLEDQAEHKANDREYLPGGSAMVALAPVANLEAWQYRVDTAMRAAYDAGLTGHELPEIDDTDEDWEPPLQTLLFWSEQWRVEHGRESDRRPTLTSEAAFIRQLLSWAWDHEPQFEDFARDINRARVRLENVLYAGNRSERTQVPCIEPDCARKPRLVKVYGKTAAFDRYQCPACKAAYTPQRFRLAKADLLASQDANRHVPMQDALSAIDRSERTFRKWLRFWHVRSYRDPLTGTVMVWWPDVREADRATPKRRRAA